MNDLHRLQLLAPRPAPRRVVLDTDTYNEIDDQFALVYAALSPQIQLDAVYAAPFANQRSSGAGDGMRKSLEEIGRLCDRLQLDPADFVFPGSETFLPAADGPVDSPAAADLIRRARAATPEDPLTVIAIGAPTNVASAILQAPDILDSLLVVWLGGHGFEWPDTREFNLLQDLHASRVLLNSGAALSLVPCCPVAEKVQTTHAEIDAWVRGRGAVGDYLSEIFEDFVPRRPGRSKVLWDLAAIARLACPDALPVVLRASPLLNDNFTYSHDPRRHQIQVAWHANRDKIFTDFFALLT